ncbi:MAG: hypothetical protein JW774_03695 [Candidatus Aureabacteria bacterium]|nr:hypothetical protein [Candidatus Auribacterota bacterium]
MKKSVLPEERLLDLIKKADPFHQNVRDHSVIAVKENPELKPIPRIESELHEIKKTKRFFSPFIILVLVILSSGVVVLYFVNNPFLSSQKELQSEFKSDDSPQDYRELKNVSPRPVVPDMEISYNKIPAPEYLALGGVIGGDKPAAIIQNRQSGQNTTLEQGDNFMGYILTKIEKGRVTFTKDKEIFTLDL